MADEVSIDKAQFHNRLASIITQWKADKRSGNNVFGDVGSIAVVMGKTDEAAGFHKANALQFWLLGYEFPTTLFLITLECIYILTTKKKAIYLEPLKDGKTPVEVIVRGKDAAENTAQFERCLEIIKNAGKKVGVIKREDSTGPFVTEWKSAFSEISKDVEEVEISPALSAVMSVKDQGELSA
ncbi:FACT complex subunit spt16, partial [Oleoguttula sp. CCFEE 5521]